MPTILSAEAHSNGVHHRHQHQEGDGHHDELDNGHHQHHDDENGNQKIALKRNLPSLHESAYRLSTLKSSKVYRVCFFVNGDRHFHGLNYVVNLDRMRTLDHLCADLTRILVAMKTLPSGVRFILNPDHDGLPLKSVQELSANGDYVCSSTIHFVPLNYGQLRQQQQLNQDHLDSNAHKNPFRVGGVPRFNPTNGLLGMLSTSMHHPRAKATSSQYSSLTSSTPANSLSLSLYSSGVRSKIVALIQGSCRAAPSLRPSRRAFRFLLNHRIALNFDQLLNEISNCVQLNTGAVHRVYGLSTAKKVTCLDDFFDNEYVYLVYGRTEKCSLVDFMLDECEQREIASIVRPSYQFPADLVKIKFSKPLRPKAEIRFNIPKERHTPKRPRDGNNNDKDLKAFSLPRNFPAMDNRKYQKIPFSYYTPTLAENGHSSHGPTRRHKTRPKVTDTKLQVNSDNSPFSSANSLRDPLSDPERARYYDLKNSNSDNILSEPNYNAHLRNQMYPTISNRLVFDTIARNYPSLRQSDDVYSSSANSNQPSFSGGSSCTPSVSSVSCSDDFSYAPIESSFMDQHPYKTVSFEDYHAQADDDDSSSSDSSTLSCVQSRYPGSLPPFPVQSSSSNSSQQHKSSQFHNHASSSSTANNSTESTPRHIPAKSLHAPTPELDYHESDLVDSTTSPKHKPFVPKKEVGKLYKVGKVIGDGKFGVVYTCTNRITAKVFALKVVDKTAMQEMMAKSSRDAPPPANSANLNSETAILKRINHANIIRIYDHFEYVDQSYLVLELFKGGDLFDAISNAGKYGESEAAEMVNDLLLALAYLHNKRIVHRDIKLENLMVAFEPITPVIRASSKSERSIPQRRYRQKIKLADFGLAVEVQPNELLFTVCGTPTYVAPEILLEVGYTFPVDVWAAGTIAYILLCGFPPFANEENDQDALFDQILSGKFDFTGRPWQTVSQSAKDLITSMLKVEPTDRLTASQALQHEWLVSGGSLDSD